MAGPRAAASEPRAARAANLALREGGGGLDALVAGFFAAAAEDPAVLLAPVVVLLGGVGSRARCLDGRALQPGKGAGRPRGWRPDEAIPAAAFAGVPRSVAVLMLLHGHGARPLAASARAAARIARKAGAGARARLLEAIATSGTAAFCASDPLRALMRTAGRAAGGLLTEEDLLDPVPGDEAAAVRALAGGLELAQPPWASSPPEHDLGAEIIVAADTHGLVSVLCYAPDRGGIEVPELEISLSRAAAPVRRGVARVAPGTPRPTPLPIGLLAQRAEGWFAAVGVAAARALDEAALAGDTASFDDVLDRLAVGGCRALAATVHRRQTRALRAGGEETASARDGG
jgi:gamma-glutamyltranspeptidase/glutathione hydrolase